MTMLDQALGLHQRGNLAEAERLYRQILAAEPANFNACYMLGVACSQQGRNDDALALIGRALKIDPRHVQALTIYGVVLHALGRLEDALASLDGAIAVQPDFAEAWNNRGSTLHGLNRFDDALASYDRALAIRPDFAEAWNNRSGTLQSLRRLDEALADNDKALAIKPNYPRILYNRGVILCESGRTEEGFAAFTRHAELVGASPAGVTRSNEPEKLRHDREQRDYLAGGKAPDNAPAIESIFHIEEGGRLAGPAVNTHQNVAEISQQWQTGKPPIVVIDDLLTPEALEKLRRFCLGSTVWRHVYKDGFLGAMPELGFASPLLAQIVEELRAAYPAILGGHPLLRMWGFKYDSQLRGTAIHGDKGAVNVNIWITPDEANVGPASGGLVIWDVPAPRDWDYGKYNDEHGGIRDFLARAGAKPVTVPYRANRAVIFDSDLFHETDTFNFKDGYLNRRINIALIYGWRPSDEWTAGPR